MRTFKFSFFLFFFLSFLKEFRFKPKVNLLAILCLTILTTNLKSQNDILDEISLDFSYHIIDRQAKKDVFVTWNEFDFYNSVYINNNLVTREPGSKGYLISNAILPLEIRIVQNRIGEVVNDKSFILNEKDISIIDISSKLFQRLNDWENSGVDLFSFFENDNTISNFELFSFYQSYLGITPSQMSLIFNNNSLNNVSKTQFKTQFWKITGNTPYLVYGDDVTINDELPPVSPPDTIRPQVECNCKMIKTNSSALNIPNGNTSGAASPDCNQASPTWQNPIRVYDYSNVFWPVMTKYFWDGGLLGAAKYGSMLVEVLGCKKSGIRKNTLGNGGLGASKISFQMSCYEIGKQTIKYNDKCNCEKEICIAYEYSSHIKSGAGTGSAALCDKKASIKIEDYAILTKSTLTGVSSALNSGIALVSNACDVAQDTNFVSNISSLYDNIKTVLNSASNATQIIGGVTSVGQFFANEIGSTGTCIELDTNYTLMSGENLCFSFNSQQRNLTLTIISQANFVGEANGAALAYGKLNSSFYMAAVLQTLDPTPECCQEKIGSYVLGTLMDQPINYTGSLNTMSTGEIPNLSTLQSNVGSYIGLSKPWGGYFQGSGCCDDVLIDCYSKCVHFVEGACKNIDDFGNDNTESRVKLSNDNWVTIRPIPAFSGQSIELNFSEVPENVKIINSNGVKIKSLHISNTSTHIPTTDLLPGIYFIQSKFKHNIKNNKFIIH